MNFNLFTIDARDIFRKVRPSESFGQWMERTVNFLNLTEGKDYVLVTFPARANSRTYRIMYRLTDSAAEAVEQEARIYKMRRENRRIARTSTTPRPETFDAVAKEITSVDEIPTEVPAEFSGLPYREDIPIESSDLRSEIARMREEIRDLKLLLNSNFKWIKDLFSPEGTDTVRYMTVAEYYKYLNAPLDHETARQFGITASKVCASEGVKKITRKDKTYGKINMYPLEVLRKVGQEYSFV